MPKLHVQSGMLQGKVFELVEEHITVGRATDNVIRLDDGTVSSHHATLTLKDGDYTVKDLNSTNGTRVNGLRVSEQKLQNGDIVRFGSVDMKYESDVKKASAPLPPPTAGVDLTKSTPRGGAAPPPSFGASQFGRAKKKGLSPLQLTIIGLAVLAIVAIAYFLIKFFAAT
jgi:predicted component of type VI protein secretion system